MNRGADKEEKLRAATFQTQLPKQDDEHSGFDVSPKAVDDWLDKLDLDSEQQTLHQLIQALHSVNRCYHNGEERFDFLEHLRPTSINLLHRLRGRFALEGRDYDKALFNCANLLLSELIIGYRTVLREGESVEWEEHRRNQTRWITAQHRLLDCCATVLRYHRLVNLRSPEGVWLRIHRIYRRAAKLGWEGRKIAYLPSGPADHSIEKLYKHTLLSALLTPENDCRELYELLHELLEEWTALFHIAMPQERSLRNYPLRLLTGRDARPRIKIDPLNREVTHLRLDYRPLQKYLEKLIARSDEQRMVSLRGHGEISQDVLQLMLDRLHILGRKREKRAPSGRYFNVMLGLNALHEHLNRVNGKQSTSIIWSDQSEPFAALDEPVSPEASCELPDQPQESVLGQALNESERGCCLSMPRETAQRAEIGDLIALSAQHQSLWRLGVIRWLQSGMKGQVLAGIELIGANPVPFELVVFRGDDAVSRPLSAVLALDNDNRPLLISPYLPGLAKRRLGLSRQKQHYKIRVGERRLFSTHFEALPFIELKTTAKQHYVADVLSLLRQAVLPPDAEPIPEPI